MFQLIKHHFQSDLECDYRTEDVKFSPSGTLIAIAATDGCILICRVNLGARPISIELLTEIRSQSLAITHGVDFLNEETIVVANRDANLAFFSLKDISEFGNQQTIEPIYEIRSPFFGRAGTRRLLRDRPIYCGPGSVRCSQGTFFVCCNFKNTVSAHGYQLSKGILTVDSGRIIAQDGIEISDGVAISRDTKLLAASDHDHHRIIVYRRNLFQDERLSSDSKFSVVCTLNDTRLLYPHGLCFDKDGSTIFVADAGSSHLYIFRTNDEWNSNMETCSTTIDAVDMEAFAKSQMAVPESVRMLEGGAKGIDIDPSGRYIVTTCRNQIIRFFGVDK